MKWLRRPKLVTGRVSIALLAASTLCAVAAEPIFAGDDQQTFCRPTPSPATAGSSERPTEKTAGAAPGMTIYIDPQTGAILSEPVPGTVPLQLTPNIQNALSTSAQGLVEAPSPVPGGGIAIDLQGRFQNPLFAIIGPDGKGKIGHLHELPEAPDKK